MIDNLPPLDPRIFGILKANARQLWRTHYHDIQAKKTTGREKAPDVWRTPHLESIENRKDLGYFNQPDSDGKSDAM
jgi:hypothetical protein